MLVIKRDRCNINLELEYPVLFGSNWIASFRSEYANEHYAQVTYASMNQALMDKIKQVRREAYEEGWKDKSGKKPKQTWFSCEL